MDISAHMRNWREKPTARGSFINRMEFYCKTVTAIAIFLKIETAKKKCSGWNIFVLGLSSVATTMDSVYHGIFFCKFKINQEVD